MEPEFAPQYSPRERWRRLAVHGVLCVLMLVALYFWVWPKYRAISAGAACSTVFGVPGSTLLIYGSFVGAPLAAALVIVMLTARISMETILTRQYPPPGRKVFGRVKVKRGWQAVAIALVPAMFITFLCVLSSQGMQTASRIARDALITRNCGPVSDHLQPERPSERRRSPGTPRPSR